MARDPSHVFLSGATGDFQKVRIDLSQALTRGLCKVTHQESFPQTTSDTLLKLAQLIEPCGIIIHMIGENPGSIPTPEIRNQYIEIAGRDGPFLANRPELREALDDFSTITYTQWEAYIAIHRGIPLLVYADASHASPTHPQRAHLDRLQEMVRYATPFEDHSSLHHMVMADLMAHFSIHPSTEEIISALKLSNLPGGYIGRLFLGREKILATLHQSLIGHGNTTAITQKSATGISGLGGIGKTHAAIEYAHRHREDYTALLFASADSPEKLHSSLAALCEVLRLDENGSLPPDEPVRVRAALDWLGSHSGWLLIFDNVDDEPAAKAVQEILGQLTFGHVLITSRLHGWSDQVKNIDLEVLSETAAAELLLQLTANRRRLASDDESQANQLARLLEGLPLAIHQAAGYINEQTLTIAAYVIRYEEESANLLNWFNDLSIPYERPEKLAPKPVLVTWKTSFKKLTEGERFWLLVFSHFAPEPIPEFLLEPTDYSNHVQRFILSEVSAAIAHAEKYSLLTRSRTEPFFKIHRLVQQVTRLQHLDDDRHSALEAAISLIDHARPGDPTDVRNWPKWNSLQAHAVSICRFSIDDLASEKLSDLLSALGSLLKQKALFSESEKYTRRALKIDLNIFGVDHPNVASDLNNLAVLLATTNRPSEAEMLMREAMRIDCLTYGENHPIVASRLNNLAVLLQSSNKSDGAETLIREALRINQIAYGANHQIVAHGLATLSAILQPTNRNGEAEPMMREALKIDRSVYGDDHPTVALRLNNLAQLLKATNRLAEAEPMMREALRIDRAAYGNDHPDVAIDLNNLAQLLKSTRRLPEAESLMREALRIDRAAYGENHPDVATDLNNLAALLWATTRLAEAELLMQEALRILNDSLGLEHPTTVGVSRNLDSLRAEMSSSSAEIPKGE